MFHIGLEDGRKGERFGEASRDFISNQFEDGIPTDQHIGARQMEEHGKKCSKWSSRNQILCDQVTNSGH